MDWPRNRAEIAGFHTRSSTRNPSLAPGMEAALNHGQTFFRVHIFPFELTEDKLVKYKQHEWFDFWKNLQSGYKFFEQAHIPPNVTVHKERYIFN